MWGVRTKPSQPEKGKSFDHTEYLLRSYHFEELLPRGCFLSTNRIRHEWYLIEQGKTLAERGISQTRIDAVKNLFKDIFADPKVSSITLSTKSEIGPQLIVTYGKNYGVTRRRKLQTNHRIVYEALHVFKLRASM